MIKVAAGVRPLRVEERAGHPPGAWAGTRPFLSFVRPYRGAFALSLALALAAVGVTLVLPLGLRDLLDAAVRTKDVGRLSRLAVEMVALYAARVVLQIVGQTTIRVTGERVVADIRLRVYEHLHRMGLRFFSEQRVGDLISRLASDAATLRSTLTDALVGFVLQSARVLGSIAIMLALNWRLTLLVLVVAPTSTFAGRYAGRRVMALSRTLQDQVAHAMAMAQEAFAAVRLVQTLGRTSYEVERYGRTLRDIVTQGRGLIRTTVGLHAGVEFVFSVVLVALFWYGGREVIAGRSTAGDVVAFMFYAQGITQGVTELLQLYTTASASVGAAGRLFDLLALCPELVESPHAVPIRTIRGAVSFDDVSFAYDPEHIVLHDVSFDVTPGERVAIVGPSGAGKTTLLQLIPRLYDCTAGAVRVDGVDVRDATIASLRRNVALVSQDVYLFNATIRENLRYGRLDASDADIERAVRAAHADEFIARLPHGYDTVVGEGGMKLSGGQRQRVSIARAVLRDAPILLLDEATSSVDVVVEAEIREALQHLSRDRTTIIVTHRLAAVLGVPRIIVLDGGTVVEDGSHTVLVKQAGLYARMTGYHTYPVAVHGSPS